MSIRYIAFTARGRALAERLAERLGGEVNGSAPLEEWTAAAFASADALVFVGAVGIAVRAIAPHIRHKSIDPAVVVLDEGGSFAIPILSGHLGGANALARKIASLSGAVPVITTATDLRGVFAVDEWAKRQGLIIQNPEYIKHVSAKLLSAGEITVTSDIPISGTPPENVRLGENGDVRLSVHTQSGALWLVPKAVILGIGCRKGVSAGTIEAGFLQFTEENGLAADSIYLAASIDIKKDEPGLLEFCARRSLPFVCFSAGELGRAEGDFTSSGFVARTTGVDNVCERSAVLAGGRLFIRKRAVKGVTFAAALRPPETDWRWKDE